MADARALLRAHRSENRIQHPQAAYSDAGKLLCKLCHEHIRSESLWDTHTKSSNHQTKLRALQQQQAQAESTNASSGKRKLDDVNNDDEDMQDATTAAESSDATAQIAKRSKTSQENNGTQRTREKTISPPLPTRRTSNTPIQGVEIAIPSRPATPLARSDSATSTPNIAISSSRSPLISIEGSAATGSSTAGAAKGGPISTEALQLPSHGVSRAASVSSTAVQPPTPANERAAIPGPTTNSAAASAVDESEWAAFEAELAEDDKPTDTAAAPAPTSAYVDATISAPAMTKAELDARSQEEINEHRKQLLDAQIAGEKEDAARALEDEFDEMEELEGRVKRLKERREQLRRGSVAATAGSNSDKPMGTIPTTGGSGGGSKAAMAADGKENGAAEADDDDDEEDEEDEEDDEWDGFRFRA